MATNSSSNCSALNCIAVIAMGFALAVPSAQAVELMSSHVAAQVGLEEAWNRHVFVPAGAQSIVDQQIFVHESDPNEYLEIVASQAQGQDAPAKVMSRIPISQLGIIDPDAALAEAQRLASNEVRRMERRGTPATIRNLSVPRVNLYTISNDGTIDCRNAETGQPVWRKRVGDPRMQFFKMGINDQFLTVINGGNLIKVDVVSGEEIESVRTNNVPLYGAINSSDYSLVPTIRGGIEGYSLKDPDSYPFTRLVDGIALAPPSSSPGSTRLAWGTSEGFVYVMELQGTPSVQFRLDTDGIVSAKIAAINDNRFFFGSENGQVYGLKGTRLGDVMWSRPYADPFYNSPMVYGEQVFLRSTYGNLYALRIEDGFMTWPDTISNVDELIGVFNGKLYVRLLSGHLSVIDTETGKTDRTFYDVQPKKFLANSQTDRLYFVADNGAVQCLRPIDGFVPSFNELLRPIAGDQKSETEQQSGGLPMDNGSPILPTGDDPFAPAGAADDPFAPAGDDPFAPAGDDPFGGAGGGMEDPFGGDDPFAN